MPSFEAGVDARHAQYTIAIDAPLAQTTVVAEP
jgi:hypothetical protein